MSVASGNIGPARGIRDQFLPVHATRGDADSWSVEHGSEFERILDAHLAAAPSVFRFPAGEPPVVDTRPDPAIRLAMWGGGIPSTSFRGRPAHAWERRRFPWEGVWSNARANEPTRANEPDARGRPGFGGGAEAKHPPDDGRPSAATGGRPATRAAGFAASPATSRGRPATSDAERPPVRRVARRLSAVDRDALDLLRRSGAALQDDFTDEELKAAYRQLAFRFHPDQHPGASAAERLHLGRSFSQVHVAYRSLRNTQCNTAVWGIRSHSS